MAEKTGLVAIIDDADGGAGAFEDAEQLALSIGLELPAERRGRGRPPGRRNQRNQRVADFVLAQVGDPLLELARMALMPVGDLAAALKCSLSEAFAEKRLCALGTLPYLHQRQPLAVDLRNHQVVHLTIQEAAGDAPDAAGEAPMTISAHPVQIVENQRVSEGDDEAV